MSRQYNRDSKVKPFVVQTSSDDVYKLSHAPQFRNVKQYIEAKLTMLMDPRGFCINVTEDEVKHLYDLARESEIKNWDSRKTEETINRAVRQIINDHWK